MPWPFLLCSEYLPVGRLARVFCKFDDCFCSGVVHRNSEVNNCKSFPASVSQRETVPLPYRSIYRVLDKNVYVLLIADGRRDMQSLLQRRLLDA
jgi:hypothetical protein